MPCTVVRVGGVKDALVSEPSKRGPEALRENVGCYPKDIEMARHHDVETEKRSTDERRRKTNVDDKEAKRGGWWS